MASPCAAASSRGDASRKDLPQQRACTAFLEAVIPPDRLMYPVAQASQTDNLHIHSGSNRVDIAVHRIEDLLREHPARLPRQRPGPEPVRSNHRPFVDQTRCSRMDHQVVDREIPSDSGARRCRARIPQRRNAGDQDVS